MLTARAEPEQRIEGLEIGVDDYISKPFEPRELLLRLQNILKRGRSPTGPREEIRMGDFAFHVDRGELKRGEDTIKLTERERDLLRMFAQRGSSDRPPRACRWQNTGSERAIGVPLIARGGGRQTIEPVICDRCAASYILYRLSPAEFAPGSTEKMVATRVRFRDARIVWSDLGHVDRCVHAVAILSDSRASTPAR
jgi:hypothetical protein